MSGNGRARAGAYRSNHLVAYEALSHSGNPVLIIGTLDFAQKWVCAIDYSDVQGTTPELQSRDAFIDSGQADDSGLRLRLPNRN